MRAAIVVAAALVFTSTALAAPPTISATATTTSGGAPLHVVFTASGDAATYHWAFGDGASADGAVVEHVYGPGAFVATLTGTNAAGESASTKVRLLSFALTLRAKRVVGYRRHLRFQGRLIPALRGRRIGIYGDDGRRLASGVTRRGGRFRIGAPVTKPGTYQARLGTTSSLPVAVAVRPQIVARFVGSGFVGHPLRLRVQTRPAAAGALHVVIRRNGKPFIGGDYATRSSIKLPTGRAAQYRIALTTRPAAGYAVARLAAGKSVVYPRLQLGSRGPSVHALNLALWRLHIAVAAVDSTFGFDTRDAVVAFQKLHGLPRTGSVDARFWRALADARTPRARYGGNHIEVSKRLQVLLVVRNGEVILVSHVSTGATGNTPVGRWHVYSKVPGWLPDLMFDSSFFLRGFAIHGYPSVPFYPGSHGCVRVPVWLAPRVYRYDPPGSTIYIY